MNLDIKKIYHSNGNLRNIIYYLNDEFHREDGPAHRYYYTNGNICYEEYYINGKFHRQDGPAIIGYNVNGNIDYKYYYLNGKQITKSKFLIYQRKRKLKSL